MTIHGKPPTLAIPKAIANKSSCGTRLSIFALLFVHFLAQKAVALRSNVCVSAVFSILLGPRAPDWRQGMHSLLEQLCMLARCLPGTAVSATLSPDQLRDTKKELGDTVAIDTHAWLPLLAFVVIIPLVSFLLSQIVHHSRTIFSALCVPVKGCECVVVE